MYMSTRVNGRWDCTHRKQSGGWSYLYNNQTGINNSCTIITFSKDEEVSDLFWSSDCLLCESVHGHIALC